MVGNISKWGCGTILVLIAFVVAVGIAGAILLPEPDEGQSTKEPQKEEVLNPKEEPVRKPVRKSESQGEPKTAEVRADVEAYYDAAARGDYEYTYEHLTKMDRMSLSREEWLSANQTLQSDQATYEITDMRRADFGGYDVELTVNGEPHKTTFVKEFGTYMHELSGEELTMFTDALYSASAGTSASASAAPGVEPSGGNTVSVVDVVDGDTFDIDPAVKGMDRVRLIGVDTPEVFSGEEPCGQEASDFTTQQLEGQQVSLEVGENPEDPFGRLLAYVWVDGQFFNETLVSEGLAEAVSYPPNTKYDSVLEAAEATAKTPVCGGGGDASAGATG